MILSETAQIFAFAVFAFISVAGAVGMTTTMSMFRSGIFLMASFIGVAGLFILLLADLLGLLQIMMYIGGMLVMILFMVLFSNDPGGAMMANMKMPFIEKFFSLGLTPKHKNKTMRHGGMDMSGMSMMTPIKPYAAVIGILTGALFVSLILLFPEFKEVEKIPDQNSAWRIGLLLMGKYMMAFEGAGMLILLGIFGAVFLARPDKFPDLVGRDRPTAIAENPEMIDDDIVKPLHPFNVEEFEKQE